MGFSKNAASFCARALTASLMLALVGCSLGKQESVTLGVSEGEAARMAVGFIAVRNLTPLKVDGPKADNNGIQYAKDLVDSQLYAYVECVSTESVAANGWIHKLEAAALQDQVFVDTNRQLKLVDAASGDPTGIVPCKILGRRLMSYPIAQRIFTTILADGAPSREALSVAQFFYLSMRGYESPS